MANKPKLSFTNIEDENVRNCKKQAEDYSDIITRIVDRIVQDYCHELDDTIDCVRAILSSHKDMDIQDLNYYIALIPVQMYYVGNALENIGIQGDSATAIRQEKFDKAYLTVEGKTINDKQSAANREVVNEALIEQAFLRAYKKAKSRLEIADTILGSLKKIQNWKTSELEVTNRTSGEGTNFR